MTDKELILDLEHRLKWATNLLAEIDKSVKISSSRVPGLSLLVMYHLTQHNHLIDDNTLPHPVQR